MKLDEMSLKELKAVAKSMAAPMYRHPENAELTWSGRGRKPKWIAEAFGADKRVEVFSK